MAHPEHPLCNERTIPLHSIASHGIKPNIRMELGSNEAIKQAIIAGLGVSILSRHPLGTDGMGEPAVLDVEGFPVVNQWHMAILQESSSRW